MLISTADIRLSASHDKQTQHRVQEHLTVWDGERRLDYRRDEQSATEVRERSLLQEQALRGQPGLRLGQRGAPGQQPDRLSLSDQARQLQPARTEARVDEHRMSAQQALEALIIREMVERITGKPFELFDPAQLAEDSAEPQHPPVEEPEAALVSREAGWGFVYDRYESYRESEKTSFTAEGEIRTADGQVVAFSVELHMSREFFTAERESIRMGAAVQAKDPLVVNFAGSAAELTRTRFAFDLDADGRREQIAFVAPGSGFLAWDRNGNGQVDDGGELFGPRNGDGFAELAAHDDDGNGWIDAADSIYAGLRIWSRDESGASRLVGLGQHGVGAIYLGHVATPFELTDAGNRLQGLVRDTGLFVAGNGSVGTVQQLDLVV